MDWRDYALIAGLVSNWIGTITALIALYLSNRKDE